MIEIIGCGAISLFKPTVDIVRVATPVLVASDFFPESGRARGFDRVFLCETL